MSPLVPPGLPLPPGPRIAVVLTACKRPYYLAETLASWERVRGIEDVAQFAIQLGRSPRDREQRRVIEASSLPIEVWPDPGPIGLHAAIAYGLRRAFNEGADITVYSEEDVVLSADALELVRWVDSEFRDWPGILAGCLHSRGGQGWDPHEPAQDADADQAAVRVARYFNAWGWFTWDDRWAFLEEHWDWACNSGGLTDSGWDWHLATRILPQHDYECVVPEASRTQNIGREQGWASTAESFAFSQAQSFKADREPVEYRLVGE